MDPLMQAVVGALMSYLVPGGADVWCVKVNALATGAGDVPMAWVEDVRDARRIMQVPVSALKPGCASPPAGAASAASAAG